ncbi:hypothetical protein PIB30_019580 [Stylosanthes scabra]|uniref:Secreted protein n=1 Tax=Stylosanthes scabra TaxID=79078 RepID=A0ABU6Y6Z7_9FABA|nr:hypothetical protein [Stylosanthes scabra]
MPITSLQSVCVVSSIGCSHRLFSLSRNTTAMSGAGLTTSEGMRRRKYSHVFAVIRSKATSSYILAPLSRFVTSTFFFAAAPSSAALPMFFSPTATNNLKCGLLIFFGLHYLVATRTISGKTYLKSQEMMRE